MKKTTPQEASKIANCFAPSSDAKYAQEMYSDIFHQKFVTEGHEYDWSLCCAAAAVYQAGRINGIREERQRRSTGKRPQAE